MGKACPFFLCVAFCCVKVKAPPCHIDRSNFPLTEMIIGEIVQWRCLGKQVSNLLPSQPPRVSPREDPSTPQILFPIFNGRICCAQDDKPASPACHIDRSNFPLTETIIGEIVQWRIANHEYLEEKTNNEYFLGNKYPTHITYTFSTCARTPASCGREPGVGGGRAFRL